MHSGAVVLLRAAVRGEVAACPACSKSSSRVHSRYRRTLADSPMAGRLVRILLKVRRFFCDNSGCRSKTFVEQVDGLTRRWSRMSEGLRRMLTTIGLALVGRAGARLARTLGMPTGRDRLLRLVRALPDPPIGDIAVLGVDDFAIKRGHNYGTVLIDCETRKVVDVLVGRDAEPVTAWLQEHTKPAVICRDRASAYAEAARTAAPEAVQVADRFHLWQNLATAVEKCVARHKSCLAEPADTNFGEPAETADAAPTGAMAERRRAHHALVHELLAQGAGFRQIARHLGWSHRTVSKYAHAATWQELVVGQKPRPSLVDPFKHYLARRIGDGCLKASVLYREITEQGFGGSYAIVRKFVEQYRSRPDLTSLPRPPSVLQVTRWICRHPDNLVSRDTEQLWKILGRCPELESAVELVRSFADMMTHLHGERLAAWIIAAD
ncbi:ISL3 family transposase [Actinoplanes sp. NPDC023801]|uniref:ISL3 family transposase n=1 Tax=Actinoplanes sp. NPDC023801 TaxID=3154595 RepID=UPI0033EA194C